MTINQLDNNSELVRISGNLSFKETKTGMYTREQESLQRATQDTLRTPVDFKLYKKTEEDREFVKVMKARTNVNL